MPGHRQLNIGAGSAPGGRQRPRGRQQCSREGAAEAGGGPMVQRAPKASKQDVAGEGGRSRGHVLRHKLRCLQHSPSSLCCLPLAHPTQAPQRAAHAATLLGATSTACDAPRLLQSYTAWATPLLDMLKRERDALLQGKGGAGSAAAVQAACLSLAQLFQR